MMEYKYDVTLSFAGEDREYVEKFAKLLEKNDIKVFYDKFEEANLWGKDLGIHFDTVYRKSAKYCILFISKYYKEKVWTNYELKTSIAGAIQNNSEYILPARFDDTEIDGVRPTIGYINLQKTSPEKLAELFLSKLKENPSEPISEVFQEKRDDIVFIALYNAFVLGGSFGASGGDAILKVTITNKLKAAYHYYYEPLFKLTIPFEGADAFQLLSAASPYKFPVKLKFGEEITIDYNLSEVQLEVWEKMDAECEVFAVCTTTIGERFESNSKKVKEIINVLKMRI